MNFFPLWTASVCPTMSGRIVERRDHVFSTRLSPELLSFVIFSTRCPSTNGPFFVDRDMELLFLSLRLLLVATLDDQRLGPLVVPGLEALRLPAPRRAGVPAARRLSLAAPHRVVDRVHGNAAVVGFPAEPAVAAGLPDRDVLVLEVSDLADRGIAVDEDLPELAGRDAEEGVVSFLRHQLRAGPCRAGELRALDGLELDRMDDRADRDRPERQGVPRDDVGREPRDDDLADLEAVRRDDVPLLAVRVDQQGDAGRAVRVVLDRRDPRRDPMLLALEVDVAETLLVPAAAPPGRELAGVLPPARPGLAAGERLLRRRRGDVREARRRPLPETGRGRFVRFDRHRQTPSKIGGSFSPAASFT